MKRPGFQKMLTAIEAGYISAVFVKDLSRLGRNYIEVGKLTEEFFPLHDIRLVAASDGVDSDEGEDDFTPFKNIMNEYYAKDNHSPAFWSLVECVLPGYKEQYHWLKENGSKIIRRLEP